MNRFGPVGLIALALTLNACGGTAEEAASDSAAAPAAEPTAPAPSLTDHEWRLVVIDMADGEDMTPDPSALPRLSFSEEAMPTGSRSMSGFTGCNRLTAGYDAGRGGRLSVSGVAMTRMACPDDIMRVESVLVMALESATSYELTDGEASIGFGGGTIRLEIVEGT
jgi:heat shock protein HslJ